jgi:hypothetical protein
VFAGIATARAGAPTTLTITGQQGDYHGKVLSAKRKCMKNRQVTAYKQKGAVQQPSSDKKIGNDTSSIQNGHGVWDIGNSGFKHGNFYARAKHSAGCHGGRSPTIHR